MRQMRDQNKLTEAEIDELVITEVDGDAAWEDVVQVQKPHDSSLHIPTELAERAAFLANLHRGTNLDTWLTRVIHERVELEECAFFQAKRALVTQP